MIKHIAIVSLSSGTIGEEFVQHEVEIGTKRLQELGLKVTFMPHARKGLEYTKCHPAERASDLLQALKDPEIDMILCSIGGDDTYRLLPYLFEHNELAGAVSNKIFLGFSDSTINHFMFHKVGMKTFYGQSFLADVCELDKEMLPYTKQYFEELIRTESIQELKPSEWWYESRMDFGMDQIGKPLKAHADVGYELLQGNAAFSGEILGGCIDSMYDCFFGDRYEDMPILCERYQLFPNVKEWMGKILLLESSEEKMSPEKYRKTLFAIKERGIFEVLSGVLVGKPMDEVYAQEYKKMLVETIDNPNLPIVCNLNVGHAQPRGIIPLGILAEVDATQQVIRFFNESVGERSAQQATIRYIEPKDENAIAKIVRENLKKYQLDIPGTAYYDPQLDCLSRYYAENAKEGVYFIAESKEGDVIGGIGMERFEGFPRCGEIQKLYVSEGRKKRGLGQKLLETIETYAQNKGFERLYLETHSNLREAVRLYEKNGYHKIERPKEVVHSTMDLFYVKEL